MTSEIAVLFFPLFAMIFFCTPVVAITQRLHGVQVHPALAPMALISLILVIITAPMWLALKAGPMFGNMIAQLLTQIM